MTFKGPFQPKSFYHSMKIKAKEYYYNIRNILCICILIHILVKHTFFKVHF